MSSKIEWCDETWNVVSGCTKIAAGCTHCYAERLCHRFWKQWDREPPPDHFKVRLHPDRLDQPMRWKKPRRVFVCSMGDLFHEDVPNDFRTKIYDVMAGAEEHTFVVLTKRPENIHHWEWWVSECWPGDSAYGVTMDVYGHIPNVQLGVSVSTQDDADRNIAELLRTPAAVRIVSVEPMLERVDLSPFLAPTVTCPGCGDTFNESELFYTEGDCRNYGDTCTWEDERIFHPKLNWVICGCESGPNRRPMKLEWAVNLVSQCKAAGVACFVKQIEVNGKVSHDPAEWDPVLQVREYPDARD